MSEKIYDVIIIGGGPSGSTAALYTARASLSTLVLDMAKTASALNKAPQISNFPSYLSISGTELLDKIREQAKSFKAEFSDIKVTGLILKDNIKQVFSNDGKIMLAKSIIIASGAMQRSNYFKGEQEFIGKGVSYCAICDAAFFQDREVLVYGDNEYAIEEAIYLTRFASLVHLIFKKELQLNNPKIKVYQKANIKEIAGSSKVEKIIINSDNNDLEIFASGIFLYGSGNKPAVDFLYEQVELDPDLGIKVDNANQTNIAGVFACGDVIYQAVKQVVTACSSGCIAGLAVDKFVNKKSKLGVDYKH